MTNEELKGLLSLVIAAYGTKFTPTEETAAAWGWILGDLPASKAVDALKVYIRAGNSFPPSPGEVYALAKKEADSKAKLPAYQLFELPPPVAKIKTASELVALAKTELSKKSKNKSVK